MSLPVTLSPFLLQKLYPHVLYNFAKEESNPGSMFVGKYEKHIAIYVYESGFPVVSDGDMDFLQKVLAACKLNIDDVIIINTAQPEINAAELLKKLKPKFTILFGVALEKLELPMIFPQYQVQYFDGCKYLHVPQLTQLTKDNEQKKLLWQSLKRMFDID